MLWEQMLGSAQASLSPAQELREALNVVHNRGCVHPKDCVRHSPGSA